MISAQQKQVVSPLVLVLFLSTGVTQVSNASQVARIPHVAIMASVTVKARPQVVWLSIHEARTSDPQLIRCKLLAEDGRNSTIKETFVVPLLGDATCTLSLVDLPPNKMSYTLIESDTFKTFNGSWTLAASADGKSTNLNLSCDAEVKKVVPQFLLKVITTGKMRKRLNFVKLLAERKELQLQTAKKPPITRVISHS